MKIIILLALLAFNSACAYSPSSHLEAGFPFPSSAGLLPSSHALPDPFAIANGSEFCGSIWCELPPSPVSHSLGSSRSAIYRTYDDNGVDSSYEDFDDGLGLNDQPNGYWLEPPPDDILYMPPPPMPPGMQALLASMENDSLRQYIITDENDPDVRCNFCKLFADEIDSRVYEADGDLYAAASKDSDAFMSSTYLLLFSALVFLLACVLILVKFKKLRIFPMSDSCPILTGGFSGHHKGTNSSTSSGESHLSPVVNEKSPQSIIMEHTLGKKSTMASSASKYWRRNGAAVTMGPNGVNVFGLEDRRAGVLRSMGGSSTCISEHPYSDAASCTSSPVYAELDPSVAGSHCATPPMIGPPGTSLSPYYFGSTYSEVPDNLRGGTGGGSLLSDSSTYDNNAAYLSASGQPFLPNQPPPFYNSSRSLRRLVAARSMQAAAGAAANSSVASSAGGNASFTPLLAGHPYHYQPTATMHHQGQHHQQQQANGQFAFLTGGRPLKKPRPQAHSTPQQQQASFNSFRFGSNRSNANHYVESQPIMVPNGSILSEIEQHQQQQQYQQQQMNPFASFLDGSHLNGRKISGGGGGGNGMQYTEMPLLNASPFGSNTYRMSETLSNQDLNSSASSSSGGGGSGSSASLKRPLPPVPGGVRL